MQNKKSFLVLIATLFLNTLLATDYYVSKQGNDSNTGTVAAPLLTINKALSKMNAGDNCFVANGTYYETVTFPRSGTCDQPISLIAQGDSVIISGAKPVNSWIDRGNGIFKTDLPQQVTQLFLNRKPQVKAKYPNQKADTNLFNITTFDLEWNEADKTIISGALNHTGNYWKGATVWAMVGHRWISQTAKVTSSSGSMLTFDFNSYEGDHGIEGIGFLTNTLKVLDTTAEWHWEKDTLYYIPSNTIKLEEELVEAKINKWVLDLSGREYIHVEGIRTFAGTINMDDAHYCVLKGMEVKYLSEYDYIDKEKISWVSSWSRHEWTNINTPYGMGIGIFGNYNRIEDCHISWSAGDGITLFGDSNLVVNSTIHDCNYRGTDCNPVSLAGKGNQLLQNEIYNGGRSVIQVVNLGTEFTVKYNRLYQSGLLNWDVGVFYAFDVQSKGSEVAYNWISQGHSDNPENWGAAGIYIDNNCHDFLIHHNVIWNSKESGIKINMPANGHEVYHNTIFLSGDINVYLHPDYAHLPSGNCKFYNNYVDYTLPTLEWMDFSNNVSTTQDFLVDREGFNFMPLAANEELIDKGKIIEGINDDYSGDAPDVGAYEHGESWSAGPYAGNIDCSCDECDEHGKAGNCECGYLGEPTGLPSYNLENANRLKIYPNPAKEYLKISLDNKPCNAQWEIVDMTGKTVLKGKIKQSYPIYLEVNTLNPSQYLLKVKSRTEEYVGAFMVVK